MAGPYEKDGKLIEPPRKKDYELSPIETEQLFENNVRSEAYKQLRDIPMRFQSILDNS